eukprot:8840041-Pyramimonas_sp.AAC.1
MHVSKRLAVPAVALVELVHEMWCRSLTTKHMLGARCGIAGTTAKLLCGDAMMRITASHLCSGPKKQTSFPVLVDR